MDACGHETVTLLDLNRDCWRHILGYLPLKDVVRSERICRQWQSIVLDYLQELRALDVCDTMHVQPGSRRARWQLLRKPGVRVRCLRVPFCTTMPTAMVQACAGLVELTIDRTNVPLNLVPVAEHCKQLKSLTIEACFDLTDTLLINFFKHHTTLEKFRISDNKKITGRFLSHAPPLRTLSIYKCLNFKIKQLIRATSTLKDLRVFQFNYNRHLIEDIGDFFKYTPKLEGLSLIVYPYARQENRGFLKGIFQFLPELKEVDLFANRYVCDKTLVQIGRWCPKLECLDVSYCGASNSRRMGVTEEGVLAIRRGCPNLTHLTLTAIKEISDSCLRGLAECANLTELIVRDNPNITADGLGPVLEKCYMLKVLDVTECSSIDSSLVSLAERAMSQSQHRRPLTLYAAITKIPRGEAKNSGPLLVSFGWRHKYFIRSDESASESESDTDYW